MGQTTATPFVLLAALMAMCAACSGPESGTGHPPSATSRAPVAGAVTAPATRTVTSPPPATPPQATAPQATAPQATPARTRRGAGHRHAHVTAGPVPYGVTCQPTALQLGLGQRLSQATSQLTLLFTLTNVSAAGCDLRGYPGVTLLNAGGRPMPFRLHWGTTDQMLTKTPPVLVPLAPGAVAYFAVSKWLCYARSYSAGRYIQVIPPNDYQAEPALRLRYLGIDYCRTGYPGNVVGVSPVEPTELAVLGLHR
jgi:Protein of unknown function (DUF4232)